MSTTETKTNAILDAISQDIQKNESLAKAAFKTLEKMSINSEEYKMTNKQLGHYCYIAEYLRLLKEMDRTQESLEDRIRFHAYYQRKKGELRDNQETSNAQTSIAVILEGYIHQYFEA